MPANNKLKIEKINKNNNPKSQKNAIDLIVAICTTHTIKKKNTIFAIFETKYSKDWHKKIKIKNGASYSLINNKLS